jgi:hypothetical protein
MLLFININDNQILTYNSFRYWIADHCVKWILHKNTTNIYAIVKIGLNTRQDTLVKKLKNKFENDPKYCKNFIKTRNIENNKSLIDFFIKYFANNDKTITKKNFNNIELKGYTTNYILTLIKNTEIKDDIKDNEEEKDAKNSSILYRKALCSICNKTFSNIYNKNTHEVKCKLKIKNDSVSMKIENFTNRLDAINSNFDKAIKNLENKTDVISNTITNIGTINNVNATANIQINNNGNTGKYMSKKDKLNLIKDMIDIDTFINNYKNNSKYHLSKDEARILIENTEKMGIEGYGKGLYTYLKKKYCLQLEDATDKKYNYYDCILPFISSDTNLRRHYERQSDGWVSISSKDKLNSVVNISDNQIFNHHQRFADYSMKTGKSRIVNVILRNACYENIEPELKRLSKITHLEIEPVEN